MKEPLPKVGQGVRRVQTNKKFGVLPQSTLNVLWIVIGHETKSPISGIKHPCKMVRCIKLADKKRVERGELDPDFGTPLTLMGESTIFFPEEIRVVKKGVSK